jgi:hybrid cluster-associated redox disulfide protein
LIAIIKYFLFFTYKKQGVLGMQDINTQNKKEFTADMTVGEALALHPEAGLVFASYHLGGCSHCSINELETIEQVCMGYGVPVDQLLDSLNNLLED